jgi:phage terminase large subunit GpA-like protein
MRPQVEATFARAAVEILRDALPMARVNDTGSPVKWALEHRWLAEGESPLSPTKTKFNFDATPYSIEPCESAVDPTVQTTVLWWASNTGKTSSVFFNVLGFVVNDQPGGVLWALKTQEQAGEISKKLIAPAIAASPNLSTRFASPKSRDSGNTIHHKLFAGGSISMIGTESVTGFRANRSPYVIGDEIDSWEGAVGEEGDPVGLLLRRADGFPRSIRMLASTGTIKGHSRIEYWYSQSDQRKWFVPCRKCGQSQLILWAQVRWPKGKHDEAKWYCAECDAEHDERQRREVVRNGVWQPTAPFTGIRGYWLNGFNSLMPPNKGYKTRLHQWAKEVSDASHAQDPRQAKKVLVQTLFTETWQDDEDIKPEWQALFERRKKWTAAPKAVVFLVAGVDVQADRVEGTLWGIGRGEQMFALEHIVIFGDPREPEVWGRLEASLGRGFPREDGRHLTVKAVGVDTGYPSAQRMAYEFIRPRQSRCWFALKGSSQVDADIVVRPKRTTKVDRVTLVTVGGNRAKGIIYDRCTIMEQGNGYMHFSDTLPEDWFRQLLCENSYPIFKAGVRYRQFIKPANARNEALDCAQYALAAYVALGPMNFDSEDAKLEAQGQAPAEKKPINTRRGFVGAGGWRI